ncbi:hypothetical protein ACFUTX_14250 [Microbacterium sp. NPDC057407]|uniref:hypothetical protein n=1 Tax=Microbacterium sp. NPDC057407 TaxID=3346120 RepID=UPI00366FDA2A
MAAVLKFIAWVAGQVWRWGAWVVAQVAAWAKANWFKVQKWLERGVAWGTIVQWILQALGLA